MKRNLLTLLLSFIILNSYSQNISNKTKLVINSMRSINEIRYYDIDEEGNKTSQYFNFQRLLKTANKEELLYFANDSNAIIKGYAYLALLEKKDKDLEKFYIRSILEDEKVITYPGGIYTEFFLSDFLRSKVYDKISSSDYDTTDIFYTKLNSSFDSIIIMNYKWDESDVFMDHIIESTSEDKVTLTNRKRWLANSYFIHKIAKSDDDYLYGELCGYPATMPYLRSILEASIKDTVLNRVDYFDKWISCDLFVIKVYGAEALIRLQNEGEQLSAYQIELIKELKSSYKGLQMCMNYFRERKPVKYALKNFELKED